MDSLVEGSGFELDLNLRRVFDALIDGFPGGPAKGNPSQAVVGGSRRSTTSPVRRSTISTLCPVINAASRAVCWAAKRVSHLKVTIVGTEQSRKCQTSSTSSLAHGLALNA
jgi:hypothetical protein